MDGKWLDLRAIPVRFFFAIQTKGRENAILKTYSRPFAVRKLIYIDGKHRNIYFFPYT